MIDEMIKCLSPTNDVVCRVIEQRPGKVKHQGLEFESLQAMYDAILEKDILFCNSFGQVGGILWAFGVEVTILRRYIDERKIEVMWYSPANERFCRETFVEHELAAIAAANGISLEGTERLFK